MQPTTEPNQRTWGLAALIALITIALIGGIVAITGSQDGSPTRLSALSGLRHDQHGPAGTMYAPSAPSGLLPSIGAPLANVPTSLPPSTRPAVTPSHVVPRGTGSTTRPPVSTTPPATRQRATVAFLGDSFTQAAGASSPVYGWTSLVCRRFGWEQNNFGEGGSGYTTPGQIPSNDTYPERVPFVAAVAPSIVIVSGGMNDEGKSTDADFVAAVTSTFQQLRTRLPSALIIGVNPFWDSAVPPARLATMAQEIAAAVRAVGGTYLDVGDPLQGHRAYLIADGVHPNDAGHAALAAAFVQAYLAR